MSQSDDFSAFLIGLVVGGITGAAVSLLLAPQSGDETRKILKEKAIELKDKASESYVETKDKAAHLFEEGKTLVGEVSQKGKVVLEEQREKLAETIKPKKPVEE